MVAKSLPARTFEPLVFAAWGFRRAVAAHVGPAELFWVRIGGAAGAKMQLRLALERWEGGAGLGPASRGTLHPKEMGRWRRMKPRRNVLKARRIHSTCGNAGPNAPWGLTAGMGLMLCRRPLVSAPSPSAPDPTLQQQTERPKVSWRPLCGNGQWRALPNPPTFPSNGPLHSCLSATITIIIGTTSASREDPLSQG
jgi:hypothetical protein